MKKYMYNLLDNNQLTFKKKVKIFLFVMLFCCCIYAIPSFAGSLGGYELPDLYSAITRTVKDVNKLLSYAFAFITTSPWNLINNPNLPESTQKALKKGITAIESASLAVAVLLLSVEFFKKTITFEWASKWENVLVFLIKVIVIKVIIQNAETIIGYVYAAFNTINTAIIGVAPTFLPAGNVIQYRITHQTGLLEDPLKWAGDLFTGATWVNWYNISQESVNIFYPGLVLPTNEDYRLEDFLLNIKKPFEDGEMFTPIVERVLLEPYFLVMWGIAAICFVIIIGRLFELTVRTIFAPLAFATFASDETHDIGKNFLKTYIACVLQIAVIAVMFMVYVSLTTWINETANTGLQALKLIQFICLISLGLGVIKSGAWSKSICGVG